MTLRRLALAPLVGLLVASGAAAAQATGASAAPAAPEPAPMIGLTTQTPPIGADSALEARVKSVSATLRCPVCQGLSLQDSPSELAQQMRGVVRDQMAQGKSDDEVRQYFIAKYGDWILLKPEAKGFASLVYLMPLVFLVVGGGVVWWAAKRWSRPVEQTDDTVAASDPVSEPATATKE